VQATGDDGSVPAVGVDTAESSVMRGAENDWIAP
jgi:hypothetical protein